MVMTGFRAIFGKSTIILLLSDLGKAFDNFIIKFDRLIFLQCHLMLVAAYGYENVLFWHLKARPDEGLQVGLESTQYISLHEV